MRDDVDELDLALVHALQLWPRASWVALARILDIDPATATRRWERLQQAGLAWVACTPEPYVFDECQWLYIEVDCQPGALEAVCAHLVSQPHVTYAQHMSGPRPLLIEVAVSDLAAASSYLQQDLDTVPGVRACHPEVLVTSYGGGGRWRLRALDPEQQRTVRADVLATTQRRSLDNTDRRLVRALAEDVRAPYATLAERAGVSEPTARRRVSHLIGTGLVELRCEIAQAVSSWPIGMALWAAVPPQRLEQVGRSVAAIPEVRACSGVSGARNLFLEGWLGNLSDLPKLEETIAARFPDVTVADRAWCLRPLKHRGQLLDADGRSTGFIPITIWRPKSTVKTELRGRKAFGQ